MIIEKATLSNLEEVTNLAMQLWSHSVETDLKLEFKEILESVTSTVYVASVDNRSIGFIQVSLRNDYVEGSNSSPVSYVEGIYVEEVFRHQGISIKLLKAGEHWAKSLGCSEIASDTELDNDGSQKFHKKLGFREVNRIVAFIKDLN